MTELWTAEQAAEYWGVSVTRAWAILADRGIKRVSGYPADEIKAVERRQGAGGGPTTYTAKEPDGTEYRFRSLDALARRLGGTTWHAVHSETFEPPYRKVEVLRPARHNPGAHDIVANILVPSESLPEVDNDY